jgi:hypothetical protein
MKKKTIAAIGAGVVGLVGTLGYLSFKDHPQAPPTPPIAIVRPLPLVTPDSPVELPQTASKHVSKAVAKSLSQEPLPSPLPAPTIPPAVRPELEQGFARIAYPGDRLPVTANVTFIVPPQMIVVINESGTETDCLGPKPTEVGGKQVFVPNGWREMLNWIESGKPIPATICKVNVPHYGNWYFHQCKLDCVEERERFK